MKLGITKFFLYLLNHCCTNFNFYFSLYLTFSLPGNSLNYLQEFGKIDYALLESKQTFFKRKISQSKVLRCEIKSAILSFSRKNSKQPWPSTKIDSLWVPRGSSSTITLSWSEKGNSKITQDLTVLEWQLTNTLARQWLSRVCDSFRQ